MKAQNLLLLFSLQLARHICISLLWEREMSAGILYLLVGLESCIQLNRNIHVCSCKFEDFLLINILFIATIEFLVVSNV
jgi:hypothetical protein